MIELRIKKKITLNYANSQFDISCEVLKHTKT